MDVEEVEHETVQPRQRERERRREKSILNHLLICLLFSMTQNKFGGKLHCCIPEFTVINGHIMDAQFKGSIKHPF